ncbi:unnamed protein product, partial [Prorocentrum cordatum]
EVMHATGLFAAADEASHVLTEMVGLRYTAAQLRFAFALLLELEAAPVRLYTAFEKDMMRDYLHAGLSTTTAQTRLKDDLRTAWVHSGHSDNDWPLGGVCKLERQSAAPARTDDTSTPDSFKRRVLHDANQRTVFRHVDMCLQGTRTAFAFVEGRSGTGKSTLASALHYHGESLSKAVINVATTGLAALQLPCGATAHSTFGLPVTDEPKFSSTLGLRSAAAARIARASLIQWDEWPARKRSCWEAVLDLCATLKGSYGPEYVPKTFVCYGDFRQIPPVVPGGSRDTIVETSVHRSQSWSSFSVFHLPTLHRQALDPAYGNWVNEVGAGTLSAPRSVAGVRGFAELSLCDTVYTENDAMAFAFPHIADAAHCATRRILTATNAMVDVFNDAILRMLSTTYQLPSFHRFSSDSLDMDAPESSPLQISAEFLHNQTHHGAPPHDLNLVVGALYELMRNFSPKDRLMNHTPVILQAVHEHHVVIRTLSGETVPLPRIVFRWPLAHG